ncbi:MAG: hypothetical protein K1X44_07730 [Alphaproteobacteria bacterium]|nr:hypothetical protein [Alphaproteobacteria bacterium]
MSFAFKENITLFYKVKRNNEEVGYYKMAFSQEQQKQIVSIEAEVIVKWLGVAFYRFEHQAREEWKDGKLILLDATTNDNGKDREVKATQIENKIQLIYNEKDPQYLDETLIPSSLWNINLVNQDSILDTVRGKIRKIKVINHGAENLLIGSHKIETNHYELTGEFNRNIWYDHNKNIVKVLAYFKDGSLIEIERQFIS